MLIKEVMTESPTTINFSQSLHDAREVMRNERLRHLPVLQDGNIVGVLSHRDLHFTLAIDHRRDSEISIEEALSPNPFIVSPETPVQQVATQMAEGRIGCALVCEGQTLCGVFTTVDACKVLSSLLQ